MKLQIKESKIKGAGRGFFSNTLFKKGDVIEICPTLIFGKDDNDHIMNSGFNNYVFEYEKGLMLALGNGSLYNHSDNANAFYEIVEGETDLYIVALETIKKGQEIYINYGLKGKEYK